MTRRVSKTNHHLERRDRSTRKMVATLVLDRGGIARADDATRRRRERGPNARVPPSSSRGSSGRPTGTRPSGAR
eukprot:12612-Pelagococcus_subviridis.AAC.3